MTTISVIVVNYNTRQLLLDCLQSLIDTTIDLPFEIWVVDNASSDGSMEALQASFPQVQKIKNDTNIGFAKANNQALVKAKGDVLILLNPDTQVHRGTISALVQVLEDDKTIGVVGPQILNPDGSIQPSCGTFASAWTEFLFQTFLFKVIPSPFPVGSVVHPLHLRRYNTMHGVDWVTGASLAIRKDVVERIGLLDEAFFMYGEDMEWCWRARQAGYKVGYQPAAKVVHCSRQSSRKNYRSWITRYTREQLRFITLTRPCISRISFGFWICLGSILRIAIWTLLRWSVSSIKDEAQQRVLGYRDAFLLGYRAVVGKTL